MTIKTKSFMLTAFSILALVFVMGLVSADVLAEWTLDVDGSASNVDTDLSAGDFTGGVGISALTFGASGASASGWSEAALDAEDYFQITLTPNAGREMSITDINFGERRSATGITDYQVQWSKNADFSSATTIATVSVPDDDLERDGSISGLSINVDDGEAIYIRFFGYNAKGPAGTWRVNDATLSIEGTASEVADSPSLKITKTQELTRSQDGIIKVENDGNVALEDIVLTSSGDFSVTFTPSGTFDLAIGGTRMITVSSDDLENLDFGNNVVTLTAEASDDTDATATFTLVGSFCEEGKQGGDLEIRDFSVNNEGEGDDDTWTLFDVIEVEVEVRNDGDDKIKDVFVVIGLFDSDGDDIISDLDFENDEEEEIELGNINDGDKETATFRFRVPSDFEDGDYKLTVKAYSDDLGEDVECIDESSDLSDDTYESIDIERESDEGRFIAFENVILTPVEGTCGDLVTLRADVYNIGDEEQDQVRINLINSGMSLDESYEIRNNMEEGDKESISFEFRVPDGVEDGNYQLRLSSDYDYNRGNYRESSETDMLIPFKVIGCGPAAPSGGDRIAAVNAALDSDAKAGETLIIRATITSLKSETGSFIIDASGYQSWATLEDISDRVVSLGAGQSKDVTFTFDVNADVSGEESFEIEIRSGSDIETKEVAVNIESPSTTTPTLNIGDNAYLWIIGIVNVVLIVLIIIVAVRVSRR